MSEPQDAPARTAQRIADLRGAGAWRLDPLRFRYLEALARRLAVQGQAVQALLHDKLAAALADYERRLALAPPAPEAGTSRRAAAAIQRAPACPPLAALNAQLRQAAATRSVAAVPGDAAAGDELASARRFRQAWHASRTLEQVEQALERKPSNAGPLNSHALVLHSLALMRALSPEYLRRFLTQVETLQWLEQGRNAKERAKPRSVARAHGRGRSGGS